DVQLGKNKADWAEGKAIRFHALSPDRVSPFCEHFGLCGGCQWQMLPYEKQLSYKFKQVSDNLNRIAKIPLPAIKPILGAQATQAYRNKMEYTFANRKYIADAAFQAMKARGESPDQLPGAGGFHLRGFFDKVIEINTCHLQAEPTNGIRHFVADYTKAHGLPFYNIKAHEGWIRNLVVRNSTLGQWMVNVVFGYEDKTHQKALLEGLLAAFPAITTLLYTINPKKNDALYDLSPQVFFGPGYIEEALEDLRFKISPKSFFQTNSAQAQALYQVTREMAELDGSQVLYDLYCGTGSIGLFCHQGARKIIGVEAIADAIADAKINAERNGITKADFFAGDVIDICNDDFFATHGKPDVIITDPPRAGMHEKLVQKILDLEAPLVVYVSCNPATQARDLALLAEKYTVTAIQPVDMFPHTLHIENVVQLKRKQHD
ncbi:MAG: 23S rRNA (uracil(1939)-C(5))-methyltransferase RlmD, partial [Sphingobacteriia bacterium]